MPGSAHLQGNTRARTALGRGLPAAAVVNKMSRSPCRPRSEVRVRVLLIGPPGAGKGTQATRIAAHFDLVRIATGDLLRQEVASGSELGRAAKAYIDRGDLVPDDVVIAMTRERVVQANTEGGYILDGYPRTLVQAEAAYRWAKARGVPFDLALCFEIGTDELLARLAGRAREEGRSDDTEETVRHRLEVFQRQTYPLLDYYRRRGILVRIDAVGPVDAITERIVAVLHWYKAKALAAGADRPEWAFGPAEG
jgi:adenylate kinase